MAAINLGTSKWVFILVYSKYHMNYLRCYESLADDDTKQQIWLCSLYLSAQPGNAVRFYIPEDKLSWALLIDPTMRHIAKEDLIV